MTDETVSLKFNLMEAARLRTLSNKENLTKIVCDGITLYDAILQQKAKGYNRLYMKNEQTGYQVEISWDFLERSDK